MHENSDSCFAAKQGILSKVCLWKDVSARMDVNAFSHVKLEDFSVLGVVLDLICGMGGSEIRRQVLDTRTRTSHFMLQSRDCNSWIAFFMLVIRWILLAMIDDAIVHAPSGPVILRRGGVLANLVVVLVSRSALDRDCSAAASSGNAGT